MEGDLLGKEISHFSKVNKDFNFYSLVTSEVGGKEKNTW